MVKVFLTCLSILFSLTIPAFADDAAVNAWLKNAEAKLPINVPFGLSSLKETNVALLGTASTVGPGTDFYVVYSPDNLWFQVSCMPLKESGWMCSKFQMGSANIVGR